MADNYISVGHALFNPIGRDLYWSIHLPRFDKILRWSGYDDDYWWKNISTTDQFQIREHEGRTYKLNPETDIVFLLKK